MSHIQRIFNRVVFFEGWDCIPDNTLLDLDHIRNWAAKSGAIWEAEAQLILDDRLSDIDKVARMEDELGIAVAISMEKDRLQYNEYPFLSVRSLIKRGAEVSLVYWSMSPEPHPIVTDVASDGEVKFGFWLKGCSEEFCSISTAGRVVPKFADAMRRLGPAFGTSLKSDGLREISVEGAVAALFSRQGRSFDVTLSDKGASGQ